MKLLRTIRLDPSDTFVFERAAEPGEWAVSGAFVFWNADPTDARRQGALGVPRRLSRRRVARLVDAGADRRGERGTTAPRWSSCWRSSWSTHFGAPDLAAARAAAEEEVAFAESLCNAAARHADRGASHASRTARSARRSARCGRATARSRCGRFRSWRSRARRSPADDGRSRRPGRSDASANEGLLALLRPSSARPRRGRRAGGDRRIPEGLSGAAGTDAAAGSLRGRAHAARARCWPIRAARSAPTRSPRSPTPMRARTGK